MYATFCQQRHAPEDEEMSKNTYPLKLPTSVKKAAAELAATEGESLNQFIAAAVAEKVGALRAADDFLRERAGTAKPKDMLGTGQGLAIAHSVIVNKHRGSLRFETEWGKGTTFFIRLPVVAPASDPRADLVAA
jgi:light-regulated signal transduction histidine kinase (bacteriophytochrome)